MDRTEWRHSIRMALWTALGVEDGDVDGLREGLAAVAPRLATFAERFGGEDAWQALVAVSDVVRELDMDGAGAERGARFAVAAVLSGPLADGS